MKHDHAVTLLFACLISFPFLAGLIVIFSKEIDTFINSHLEAVGWGLLALSLYLIVCAGRNWTNTGKII